MKRRKVRTERELASAIQEESDEIEIEGSLAGKVIKIKAKGKVAWVVAIGAVGVAIASIIAAPATGGISTTANLVADTVAFSIFEWATGTAITLAVVSGGVAVLNKLRSYTIVEQTDSYVLLRR